MTFPTIPTAGASTLLTSSQATATTTHTFPSLTTLAQSAGDLMIAVIVCYQGGSVNAEFSAWGGGFTEFVDQSANSTTIQSIGAAYKVATGSETGTFTVTTVASTRSAMFLMTIPGADTTTPPEATAKANGTTAAADPAALNPAGWDIEDTLWVAVGANGETSLTGSFTGITAAPTNYASYLDTGIIGGDVIGAIEGAVAFRQLNAASDDVGGFTLDVSAAGNSALLLAVRPAPPPVAPAGSVGLPFTRDFDGANDRIDFAAGSAGAVPTGACTLAVILKRGSEAALMDVLELTSATPSDERGLLLGGSGESFELAIRGAPGIFITGMTVRVTDGWVLVALTKAAGTATPRGHKYIYSSATWSHANGSSTTGDTNAATAIRMGENAGGTDDYDGQIAAAAIWHRELSDSEVETLAFAWRRWLAAGPSVGWLLGQANTGMPVLDATGRGGDQTGLAGTTALVDSPPGFDATLPLVLPRLPVLSVSSETPIALADAGAAADVLTVAAAVPVADAGVGTDALEIAAAVPLADSGSAAETLAVSQPITLADTGSAADQLSVAAAVPLAEIGSSTETITVAAAVPLADSASAADTISRTITVAPADIGSAADAVSVAAAVPLTESGSAADNLSVATGSNPQLADSGSGTETFAVTVAVPLADAGIAGEALTVAAAVALTDLGAAAETAAATVLLALTDTASGSDTLAAGLLPDVIAGYGTAWVGATTGHVLIGATAGTVILKQTEGKVTVGQ